MDNDILDFDEENKDPREANKSIRFFLLAIVCYLFMLTAGVLMTNYHFISDFLSAFLAIIGLVAFILTILGLISGIKSIRRNEKSSFRKYLATIGNLILVLIIVLMILANVLDFYRHID